MKISVLLISKSEYNLNAMKTLIDDEAIRVVGESAGGAAALSTIENHSPDIILMSLGAGDTDVLSLTERIIMHKPHSHVILLAEYLDLDILQSALKAGAHNVIQFPATAKELSDYIKSVYNNEKTRIEALSGGQSLSWMSRVITVFGAKGGLGKTTLATNLAVKLAEKRQKVALVDLDLQFGDVHLFLDIDPTDTIAELSQELTTPNIDLIRSCMTVHSSGVHVLCAPKSPELAELVSPEKVQTILSLLRTYYDYVIIDTPPSFSDVTITAIEVASTVLFTVGLDIAILKNTKLSLSLLESLQQQDKVRLIINKAEKSSAITANDVQALTDSPILARINTDSKVAVTALNRCIPFVTGSPNSELSRSVSSIAGVLMQGSEKHDTLTQKQKKKLGINEKSRAKKTKSAAIGKA